MVQKLYEEFVCRKCGEVVSVKQYRTSKFCPSCGTLLGQRLHPKPWVFQFNPAIYKWFNRIEENRETEQWLITRHVRDIREGDKVAIWGSGERAGIYALGEVVANPRKTPLNPEQERYWVNKEYVHKFQQEYSVLVRYLKVIADRPILEDECRKDIVLSDMTVLKNPQGTNFLLSRGVE